VLLANAFALESPHVRADAIEATEFPHLTQRHRVMGVPKTVVNGSGGVEGAMPEAAFLDALLAAAAEESP
jgi:predicted DsbA family dithiol-disulfide isomerase